MLLRRGIGSSRSWFAALFTGLVLSLGAARSDAQYYAAGAAHILLPGAGWGSNSEGQMGLQVTGGFRPYPTGIPYMYLVFQAQAVAAGAKHSLAIDEQGQVWSFGDNDHGQLGLGYISDNQSTPQLIPGLSGVVAIAAGAYHSVALTSDGQVYCWGSGSRGQLGYGGFDDAVTPTLVPGLSGVAAIAAGGSHTLALMGPLDGGVVRAWGRNSEGQVGDGTATDAPDPVTVNSLSNVVAISGGELYSLAVKADGSAYGWGENGRGQLGLGNTTTPQLSPQQIPGLSSVTKVAAASYHSVAVSSGSVYVWGDNTLGVLGLGSTSPTPVTTPTQVAGLSNIVAVVAGSPHAISGGAVSATGHTLAVSSNIDWWAWGTASSGEVGDGTQITRISPVRLANASGWLSPTPMISPAGGDVFCSDPNITLSCWGCTNGPPAIGLP